MKDGTTENRQQVILDAAVAMFATYGFRKTSMDDIARSANMSRPALYQHYRNKEDIFRSIAEEFFAQSHKSVIDALSGSEPPEVALTNAFLGQGGAAIEKLLTSPHGMELIDSGKATAGDIVAAGEARLSEIYKEWLDELYAEAGVVPEIATSDTANSFTASLYGIKTNASSYDDYVRQLKALAQMIGAGLRHL